MGNLRPSHPRNVSQSQDIGKGTSLGRLHATAIIAVDQCQIGQHSRLSIESKIIRASDERFQRRTYKTCMYV